MGEINYYEEAWKNLKNNIKEAQNRDLTLDARMALEVTTQLMELEEKSIENYKWFFKSFTKHKD